MYIMKKLVRSEKINFTQSEFPSCILDSFLKADLEIGFPPLTERYTSYVTMEKPFLVNAECKDGKIFHYLSTDWKFSPGLKDIPNSSVIDFELAFEFKSALHSQLANFFFDQLVKQMEVSFIKETQKRYGQAAIRSHILSTQSRLF